MRIVREDNREFKINGIDWKLLELENFGGFESDIKIVDNAIGDGGIESSSRVAQKDRTFVAKSRDNKRNEILRQQVNAFFIPKKKYAIYLTYMGVTRWCEGEIHRYSLPNGNVHRDMTLTVTFLCANPYMKSFDNFGQNIASVVGMVAFPYLCSVTPGTPQGITGGRFNFAQVIVLNNDGDVDTYCKAIFTAKGSVVNPKLIINGSYVRVIDSMQEGDVIEMDFAANPPTVKKNGKNYVGHCDRTSAFDEMVLIQGDSEVQFDADSGSNLLDVSIFYNKLYSTI